MSKEDSPSEVITVQPRIAQEKIHEYLNYKPKAETLEKRKVLYATMAKNARLEAVVHLVEMESADRTMDVALGLRSPREESNVLSDKESEALASSMDDYEKKEGVKFDMNDFHEFFIGSTKDQENFKVNYQKWGKEYEQKSQDPKFAGKITLDDYIRERGVADIKAKAKLVIRKSSNKFYNSNAPKGGKVSEKKSEEKRDKFYKTVELFSRSNSEALTGYSGLTPEARSALLLKFTGVLVVQDFSEVSKDQIVKFLEEIAGHMEYQYLAILEYEATYKEMSAMVNLGLTDEEWEARRQEALKKNAKNELKEYFQQPQQPAAYVSSGYEAPSVGFSSVKEVANDSGVHFVSAPGKGDNVYSVDFPTIKDAKFSPLVRIVYPKGSHDVNKATFVIEEPWADPDAQLGKPIDKQPTKEYKTSEILFVMNRMILNYVLNKRLNLVMPTGGKESPNTMIRDDLMVHFAERLFGFSLTDKRVLETHVADYEKFLIVLIRDDKKTSLEERVKKARIAMDDDSLVPYVRDVLKTEGSMTKTFDALVEEAKLRREGKEKKV